MKIRLYIILMSLVLFSSETAFCIRISHDNVSGHFPNSSVTCLENSSTKPISLSDKSFIGSPENCAFGSLKQNPGTVQSQLSHISIQFNKNSSSVNSKFLPAIDAMANTLLNNPESMVMLSGHTDSSGHESSNQIISMKRAESVKNLLIKKGVAFHRIATRGYGSSRPVATNGSPQDHRKNRRVEMLIIQSEDLALSSAVAQTDSSHNSHDSLEAGGSSDRSHSHDFQSDSHAPFDAATSHARAVTKDQSDIDSTTDTLKHKDSRWKNNVEGTGEGDHTDAHYGDGVSSEDIADETSLSQMNKTLTLLYNNGKYIEAGTVIEKALTATRKKDNYVNTDSFNALENMAKICYTLGNIEKAEIFYHILLKSLLASRYGDDVYIAVTMYNLGATLRILKEYGKAQFYYQSASHILRKKNKFHPFRAIIMEGLASISNMGNDHSSKKRYQRIAIAIRQHDPSIDFYESFQYGRCDSLSIDMDLCQMLQD